MLIYILLVSIVVLVTVFWVSEYVDEIQEKEDIDKV